MSLKILRNNSQNFPKLKKKLFKIILKNFVNFLKLVDICYRIQEIAGFVLLKITEFHCSMRNVDAALFDPVCSTLNI